MQIIVNGEKKKIPDGATLQSLLESMKLTQGRLACEVNLEIVRRADYASRKLKDGDAIEIVQMIGGG